MVVELCLAHALVGTGVVSCRDVPLAQTSPHKVLVLPCGGAASVIPAGFDGVEVA